MTADELIAEARTRRGALLPLTPADLSHLLRQFLDHVLASEDIEDERPAQMAQVLAILIAAVEEQRLH
jgi:hypothetical protein